MIKELIIQHKKEKEKLLSRNYLLREKLDFARHFLDSSLIKVITGPRRAGKSVFSFLLLNKSNFAYLNLDDENLIKASTDDIVKGIFEVYPEHDLIFFDEIQNLENWELFVNKLQRRGYNLVLTGSNAGLLSKELATALTGRYVPIEILPFSFSEFLGSKNVRMEKDQDIIPEMKGKILNHLDCFLKNGGFPEIVMNDLDTRTYLETLFDAILFKDIVKRYRVRFPQKMYDLALYMISNFCSEFSSTKIRNTLEFNSTGTVQSYLGYLEDAYLFFSLNRFSFKIGEQIKSPKKIYIVDNGLILAKSFQFSQNTGRLMENLVFLEILRDGYKPNKDVFYYKTKNNKEVDFIIRDGLTVKNLIQVCYQIEEMAVKKREIRSLIDASEELNCDDLSVITWDYDSIEDSNGRNIKFVPLWKWLLTRKKSETESTKNN
ncbi:ATP-binding protein [bacterium]|nr:ATP-binding protein [bacterium]